MENGRQINYTIKVRVKCLNRKCSYTHRRPARVRSVCMVVLVRGLRDVISSYCHCINLVTQFMHVEGITLTL